VGVVGIFKRVPEVEVPHVTVIVPPFAVEDAVGVAIGVMMPDLDETFHLLARYCSIR
jgi:hypothetical protein